MTDHESLLAIQDLMDGVEWSSGTLGAIAQILVNAGYQIRDLNDTSLNQSADGEDTG